MSAANLLDLDRCVDDLVAEQVRLRPHAVAVVRGEEQLSYRDLNAQANRLARWLRRLGVGPEVLVGVCARRSLRLVVALLAIWKAGGAYLPLDPDHPQERLAYMASDSRVSVLVIEDALLHRLKSGPAETFRLDRDWGLLAREAADDLNPLAVPYNLAYVMYTSGSTGRPKGVMVQHRSVVNLLRWYHKAFSIAPTDRGSQVARLSFDASVMELWSPLCAGAAAVLLDRDEALASPEVLQAWLLAKGVSLAFVPTPVAEVLIHSGWPEPSSLRAVLTGGDRLRTRPGPSFPAAFSNNYGPTEATVVSTWTVVSAQSPEPPSIGRPVDNARAYVVDGDLRPVLTGHPGELCVAGEGLARGYLGRPAMTAERFVPDPFGARPGSRMYRTGDQVVRDTDGRLWFVGRIDRQVKLRGVRIEPGEIEQVILEELGASAVAVELAETPAGHPALVAFVVGDMDARPAELLRRRLPDAMVPARIVPIAELPLTASQKIDHPLLKAWAAEELRRSPRSGPGRR